ncbi:MAG: hypothetical protein RIA10_10005 [Amphiplicatus sp.]
MKKSLKKEQVSLLQLEKKVLGVGAGIATLTGAANAETLLGNTYGSHTAQVTEAYLNLVQTLQAAHDALGAQAAAVGAELMQQDRGVPKSGILEAAKSVLGIG